MLLLLCHSCTMLERHDVTHAAHVQVASEKIAAQVSEEVAPQMFTVISNNRLSGVWFLKEMNERVKV